MKKNLTYILCVRTKFFLHAIFMLAANYTCESVKSIKGISLSPKEIDVLACLLSGKGTKGIGSLINNSPRTVETHMRSIMIKFGCNSREGVIDLIEKSQEFFSLKNHYLLLLRACEFKKILEKIAALNIRNPPISLIIYGAREQSTPLKKLTDFLKIAGVKCTLIQKTPDLLSGITSFSPDISIICKTEENVITPIVLVCSSNNSPLTADTHTKTNNLELINFSIPKDSTLSIHEHFYAMVFDVLRKILPTLPIYSVVDDFMSEQHQHYSLVTKNSCDDNEEITQKYFSLPSYITFLKRFRFIIIGFFILVSAAAYIIQRNTIKPDLYTMRSDLSIPHQKALLDRTQILRKMENIFDNQQQGIKNVTLVGVGGAGKTTLARIYASFQKAPLIWEINAQTKESLRNSFKDLAYALSKTPEQKKDLEIIQSVTNNIEREKQLLFFVKQRFKEKSSWLLIYDNVEELSDVISFLPEDNHVWGNGKIILTTRDLNSSNTSYIAPENVIYVDELKEEEALKLFTKILYDKSSNKLTPSQRINLAHILHKIPNFPLDISIAAYYIKNTHLTFAQYLERIEQFTKDFDEVQASLFKKVNRYTKTRFGIISSTLSELVQSNPDFKELLFLICLVGSQNIPVALLESCKDERIVEQLLYHLRKHAFITHEVSKKGNPIHTISLHQSTQAMGFSFLTNDLKKSDQRAFLDKIIKVIFDLNSLNVDAKNPALFYQGPLTLRICLLPHLITLMKRLESLNLPQEWIEKTKGGLLLAIGDTYYECFDNMFLAQKYLRTLFSKQSHLEYLDHAILAITLTKLGIISINLGDLAEGIRCCEKSLDLCKNHQLELLKSFNLKHIGLGYARKNQFKMAISYSKQALESLLHAGDSHKKQLEANIYEQIAAIYSRRYINQPEVLHAKNYVLKALELLEANCLFHKNPVQPPSTSPYFITKSKLALGIIYKDLGQYEKAIKEGFKEAEYIIENYKNEGCNSFRVALINLNYGEALLREGRLKEAEKRLTTSVNLTEKILGSSSQFYRYAKIHRAETFFRLGKTDLAYQDCVAISGINSAYSDNYDALMHLVACYHTVVITHSQGKPITEQQILTFFTKAQIFCKDFLNKSKYEFLAAQNVFEMLNNKDWTLKDFFKKSALILTAIYGEQHSFITDYVARNTVSFA